MSDLLHTQLDRIEASMRNLRIMGDSGIRVSGNMMSGLKVDLDKGEEVVSAAVGTTIIVPPGTGACCFDNFCEIDTESDCLDFGGVYQGDDTVCDPNPCACAISSIELTTRIYGSYDGLPDNTGAGYCSFSFDATEFRTYTATEDTPGDGEFNVYGLDPDCVINLPNDLIIFDVSGFMSGCADACDDDPNCTCSPHAADICTNPAHNLPESNCLYAQMNFSINSDDENVHSSWAGRVSCDDTGEGEDCFFSLICGTGFSHGTETETIAAVAGTYFFTYSQTTNGVLFNFEVTLVLS